MNSIHAAMSIAVDSVYRQY